MFPLPPPVPININSRYIVQIAAGAREDELYALTEAGVIWVYMVGGWTKIPPIPKEPE